jgi:hypothetical protein
VVAEDRDTRYVGLAHGYDNKPKRRLFNVLKSQGLQANQDVIFLTDGGEEIRALTELITPRSEHVLDWFHITMRVTVLEQYARGVAHHDEVTGASLLAELERSKWLLWQWLLWHGNQHRAQESISILEDDVDVVAPGGIETDFAGAWIKNDPELQAYVIAQTAFRRVGLPEAATLPCAGVTAWSALQGITAGDTVLAQGSGGVSLFAFQLAKVFGAHVIATTTSAHKTDRLKALGACEVIDIRAFPEWTAVVKELTEGLGVDRIVEVGGPGTLTQSINAVAYRGQVSVIGALTAGQDQPVIDFKQMFLSQARYECIEVGSRSDLEELIRAVSNHQLRPVIDSIFAFDDFDKALARLAGRDAFGKVVIAH